MKEDRKRDEERDGYFKESESWLLKMMWGCPGEKYSIIALGVKSPFKS